MVKINRGCLNAVSIDMRLEQTKAQDVYKWNNRPVDKRKLCQRIGKPFTMRYRPLVTTLIILHNLMEDCKKENFTIISCLEVLSVKYRMHHAKLLNSCWDVETHKQQIKLNNMIQLCIGELVEKKGWKTHFRYCWGWERTVQKLRSIFLKNYCSLALLSGK